MSTITTEAQARHDGRISALIVSVGLAVTLGAAGGHAYLRPGSRSSVGASAVSTASARRTGAQPLAAGVPRAPRDDVLLPGTVPTHSVPIVAHAVPVTLIADGRVQLIQSAATTVADLLARQGLTLGATDTVTPRASTPLASKMTIRVVRIDHRIVAEELRIPFVVHASQDPVAPRGMRRVLQRGRTGLKERVYRVTVADGVPVRKVLVGERVVRTPLDRVIQVGTWVQVASRGLFAGREYLDMVATAYAPFCCQGVGARTATGGRAGPGVVAVDPAVIPLGSRVYVDGYGYAIAGDVGGAIKGLRIDLGFPTTRAALQYGVRRVRVYLFAQD